MMLRDVIANHEHCLGLGMIDSARYFNLVVRNAEVEPPRRQAFSSAPSERGGNVRLVGSLVGAESSVSVNPKDRFFGIADVFGREFGEVPVQRRHEFDHWLFDMLF